MLKEIKIKGVDIALKNIADIQKRHMPLIISIAANDIADDIKSVLENEIKTRFKNPRPTTIKSIFVRRATRNKLRVIIGVKDDIGKGNAPAKYLQAQIKGGQRVLKRHEVLFRRKGILPRGKRTVPGKDVRLSKYGNVTGGQYTRIISYFKAFDEIGFTANRANTKKAKKKPAFFLIRDYGIYQRTSKKKIKQILAFTSKRTFYKKRFDFEKITNQTFERVNEKNFKRVFKNVMSKMGFK